MEPPKDVPRVLSERTESDALLADHVASPLTLPRPQRLCGAAAMLLVAAASSAVLMSWGERKPTSRTAGTSAIVSKDERPLRVDPTTSTDGLLSEASYCALSADEDLPKGGDGELERRPLTKTLSDCRAFCCATPGCKFYTFTELDQDCLVYGSCPAQRRFSDGTRGTSTHRGGGDCEFSLPAVKEMLETESEKAKLQEQLASEWMGEAIAEAPEISSPESATTAPLEQVAPEESASVSATTTVPKQKALERSAPESTTASLQQTTSEEPPPATSVEPSPEPPAATAHPKQVAPKASEGSPPESAAASLEQATSEQPPPEPPTKTAHTKRAAPGEGTNRTAASTASSTTPANVTALTPATSVHRQHQRDQQHQKRQQDPNRHHEHNRSSSGHSRPDSSNMSNGSIIPEGSKSSQSANSSNRSRRSNSSEISNMSESPTSSNESINSNSSNGSKNSDSSSSSKGAKGSKSSIGSKGSKISNVSSGSNGSDSSKTSSTNSSNRSRWSNSSDMSNVSESSTSSNESVSSNSSNRSDNSDSSSGSKGSDSSIGSKGSKISNISSRSNGSDSSKTDSTNSSDGANLRNSTLAASTDAAARAVTGTPGRPGPQKMSKSPRSITTATTSTRTTTTTQLVCPKTCTPKERVVPDIVIPFFERDLCKLKYTAKSLGAHDPNGNLGDVYLMWVSTHPASDYKDDLAEVVSTLSKSRKVNLIDFSSAMQSYDLDGWHAQQLLKLKIASVVKSDFYLVMDSKNTLIKDIEDDTFFNKCNQARIFAQYNYTEIPSPHIAWYDKAAQTLGVDPPLDKPYPASITPILLHKKTVLDMLAHVGEGSGLLKLCDGPLCTLFGVGDASGQGTTEFTMYNMYAYAVAKLECTSNPELHRPDAQDQWGLSLWRGVAENKEQVMKENMWTLRNITQGILQPIMFGSQPSALDDLSAHQRKDAEKLLEEIYEDAGAYEKGGSMSVKELIDCAIGSYEYGKNEKKFN